MVILPATDLAGARYVAENIRVAIESSVVEWSGKSIRMTASMGVASIIPADRDHYEGLLRVADDLLYQAKASGRNRVMHGAG